MLLLAAGSAHTLTEAKGAGSQSIAANSPSGLPPSAIERACAEYLQDQASYDRCRWGLLGWVYGPYTVCANPPRCSMAMVNVEADGLNVRSAPNGYPITSLVNGVPLIPILREGNWLLVAMGCDLTCPHSCGHGRQAFLSIGVGCTSKPLQRCACIAIILPGSTGTGRAHHAAQSAISRRRFSNKSVQR